MPGIAGRRKPNLVICVIHVVDVRVDHVVRGDIVALANLDLNLLLPLDALLRARSVTGAAAALGRSQPALSASLARLRRHFGDDLLTRVGNGYVLTPLAEGLTRRVEAAVAGVDRVFSSPPTFDARTSTRTFTVLAVDYALATIGPALATELAARAPHTRLDLRYLTSEVVLAADERLRDIDAVVMPHGVVRGLCSADLWDDSWMFLVAGRDDLGADDLARRPWVVTFDQMASPPPTVRHLEMAGVRRHVDVAVESFLALPYYVAGTDRIAMVPGRLAQRLTAAGDVRAVPSPYEVAPLVEALWWHPSKADDPGHRWLRELVVAVARGL
jgi:DNA-binding transcriptional LysR family regulator